MTHETHIKPAPAIELAGDLAPLLEQLGSPDGLATLAGPAGFDGRRIKTVDGLRAFLRNYHENVLRPLELPAIQRAFFHASRHELRELVAFDKQLSGEPLLKNFSAASRLIGRQQLQRLRPLRDERVVQRYLAAVETGEAHGWHTLVYGLTLAIYSLPLRQGLLGYAQLTTHGFISAAAQYLEISRDESRELLAQLCEPLPAVVESLLAPVVVAN